MAASARALTRAARANPSPFKLARASVRALPRQSIYQSSRRGFADASETPKSTPPPPPPSSGGGSGLIWVLGLAALGGGGYYYYSQQGADAGKPGKGVAKKYPPGFQPKFEDFQEVYNVVAKKLQDETDYDDGSYGPVLLRLGWHASGTYDAATGTGGSNGATMRFAPESDHGANAGLLAARDFLAPVKEQFPWITYSDLWTLSAVAAIQEMQGPAIPWRPGRADRDESWCTPDGRLPDAAKEQKHLRAIFGRMGFNDQEIVALSGAHALGRCHTDRSGFEGPWTFSPTVLTNDYYKLLLQEKWNWRNWNGPKQYEDVTSKSLMMLPTDMALIKDRSFKKHVERYANDNEVFFKEFGDVITKLFELGVPFQSAADSRFRFKTLD